MLIGCSGSLVDSTNDELAYKVLLATLGEFVISETFSTKREASPVTEIPNGEISDISEVN